MSDKQFGSEPKYWLKQELTKFTVSDITHWLGGTVQKYHRTVEDYFHLLQQAGFIIEYLREACPQREQFHNVQTYE